MKNTTLPRLSFHAVSLRSEFSGFPELLASYAGGCPGLDGRQRDAVLASIVAAYLDENIGVEDMEPYFSDPASCSRLLFACLLAESFNHNPDKDGYLRGCIAKLEERLGGEEYDLFLDMPFNPMHRNMELERRAHIRQGVCVSDVRKMIQM